MVVRFHVVAPASKQRTFAVRLPILLGRGDEAKFRIQHDLVSRRHCEFFEVNGRVYVHDLGSTNGTFLNDEQVTASTKTVVPPGGIVRVGGLSFSVEYQPPEVVDATAAVAGHDHGAVRGVDESRVDGNDEQEQPDFQVVHEDEESPVPQAVVAFPEQAVAGESGAADMGAADTEDVRQPEAANEPTGEPAPSKKPSEGFEFLSADAAATSSADAPQWPAADAAAVDASDNDQLNSFFKGLK